MYVQVYGINYVLFCLIEYNKMDVNTFLMIDRLKA